MLFRSVETSRLESLEHLCVGSLSLSVAPWVSHRGVADLDTKGAAVGLENAAGELRAVVGDDAVGHAKAADQTPDEFHR